MSDRDQRSGNLGPTKRKSRWSRVEVPLEREHREGVTGEAAEKFYGKLGREVTKQHKAMI